MAIDEVNNKSGSVQIKKTKFKLFCETRWVEKHTCLNDFHDMYEAFLICLEAISSTETGWDTRAVVDASGLLRKITDPTFIVSFQTVNHFFGYFSGVCRKLQGSTLDIIQAYNMINDVKSTVAESRNDEHEYDEVFNKATQLATCAELPSLDPPRRCGRQTQRCNVPSSDSKQYFHRAIYLPFVDALLDQVNMRFSSLSKMAVQALALIPMHLHLLTDETIKLISEYYSEDLPAPSSLRQEFKLWQRMWANNANKPDSLHATLADTNVCKLLFPNIYTILHLLMLTSVTSCSVERANSALKFIKTSLRSSMGEDRFNALALLFIHKDVQVDIDAVINLYARRYPRRMLLMNPLSD